MKARDEQDKLTKNKMVVSCNSVIIVNHVFYCRRDHHQDLFQEKLLKNQTLYLSLGGIINFIAQSLD